jgi:creatinine amidohydrolase
MTMLRWNETNRTELSAVLPEALVVLPIGATEQHGPHLATGTDALIAATVCERAASMSSATIVLAPPLPFGASDHHMEFGATLSLTAETMLAVLLDLIRSVAVAGGRRMVIVNGHGGNVGLAHAAADAAAVRHDIAIAQLAYWQVGGFDPGHAGQFETSVVMAIDPSLVSPDLPPDHQLNLTGVANVAQHRADIFRQLDGYTDRPSRANAAQGKQWLDQIVAGLATRFTELARVM